MTILNHTSKTTRPRIQYEDPSKLSLRILGEGGCQSGIEEAGTRAFKEIEVTQSITNPNKKGPQTL